MMTGAAALVVVLVAAVGITIWVRSGESPTHPAASPPATPLTVSVPTVLILDASGSMNQADAPGPRIEAAKTAALALIDALPDNATLGLETYGTSTGSSPAERDTGCHDVRTLIPLGPLHRDAMHTTIAGLTASGYTPISLALQHAGGQLPADNSEQAIVLVSDGEDTCNSDPCQTAAQLKIAHPNLTISTIGFKTDGPTAEQLRCIATATGGLFIQAGNTTQLTTRLIATQNLDTANNSLTPTGLGDIRLGQTLTDIHATHPDFPTTTSSANTITWRDCDYTFTNGTLSAITPHNGGRTIDGLSPGTPLTKAIDLYGQPLATTPNENNTTVFFDADPNTDHAYRISINGTNTTNTSTITSISLCRCKPHSPSAMPDVGADNVIRAMTFPPGTCGDSSSGWNQTEPITVIDGKGEARTSWGEFGGASITGAKLVGPIDADGDGAAEAVISFTCFGSTFDMCCAGRSSMMDFVRVFDFSSPADSRPLGKTIEPGVSPVRGEGDGEPRSIDRVRIDGTAIITEEKLIYPDTSRGAADLGYPPDSTIEVTHRFSSGEWVSTERVVR